MGRRAHDEVMNSQDIYKEISSWLSVDDLIACAQGRWILPPAACGRLTGNGPVGQDLRSQDWKTWRFERVAEKRYSRSTPTLGPFLAQRRRIAVNMWDVGTPRVTSTGGLPACDPQKQRLMKSCKAKSHLISLGQFQAACGASDFFVKIPTVCACRVWGSISSRFMRPLASILGHRLGCRPPSGGGPRPSAPRKNFLGSAPFVGDRGSSNSTISCSRLVDIYPSKGGLF